MKYLICLLFYGGTFFSQQKISGTISDKSSKEPIPFASIGIIGKSVGTLSDDKGVFNLALIENQKKDSLKISAIGYKPLVFLVQDLLKLNTNSFLLESLPTQLPEFTVKSKKGKYKVLGTTDYTKNNCTGFADIEGNWKGSEAAILVKNKKKIQFETFSFYVIQNKYADSLLFRLNIYERISPPANSPAWLGSDWVGNSILQKAIIFKVGTKQGEFTLPISQYNIQTSSDFFISLECLMDEMEITKFCYSGSNNTPSFFKVKAFSKWHKTGNSRGGGGGGGADFNVKVFYPD